MKKFQENYNNLDKNFNQKIKIGIGSDHNGYKLKSLLIEYLKSKDYLVNDFGTDDDINSVDYPDYANLVCESLLSKDIDFGILICGTGIGMSIAANRYSKVRAALCLSTDMAKLAKQHNNANILVLGARILSNQDAIDILEKFLSSSFDGGRHSARVDKLV
jgi:ribose 5-phosphate isomerase B